MTSNDTKKLYDAKDVLLHAKNLTYGAIYDAKDPMARRHIAMALVYIEAAEKDLQIAMLLPQRCSECVEGSQ